MVSSLDAIYELVKKDIMVLNNAVRIAKKSKCWKTTLPPSKKFYNLKNLILAIANIGATTPAILWSNVTCEKKDWEWIQKSEKCVANNAAKTTLKSNNKKHNDIAPNGSQMRLPTKG